MKREGKALDLDELLRNETLRRREFPVTGRRIFLAHAAVCPLPQRVAEAMGTFVAEGTLEEQELGRSLEIAGETRRLAARLIGSEPDEVALVGPTSMALSLVASGFPVERGENVVIYFDDYPSNVYPWMALAGKGVEVRHVRVGELGRITLDDVKDQVDARTRLVALASCHFIGGYRPAIEEVGEFLRSREVAFCVDGIQTVGAFPTLAKHCDFLAADSHKWMLGPCAAGILYVSREWQERLMPPWHGWHNVRCPDFVAQERMVYAPGARRFEPGSANLVGLVGLSAALRLLLEIGVERIAGELLRKRSWLLPALGERGYSVLGVDDSSERASGIITLTSDSADLSALHRRLAEADVVTSLRSDRAGRRYLRLSPHFYNTDEELRRMLEVLEGP